jgi:hypothetical protein
VRIPISLLASLGLLLGVSAGCDRNTEEFVEGEEPRAPDLARIFPESDGSAERPDQIAMPAPAAPARGAPPVQAAESDASITGTIALSPGLAGSAPAGAMLFVIARPAGVGVGPPLAVQRIPAPRFPVEFEVGPDDVMIPTMRFEGEIDLAVRLDSDGNAMTKQPGDLSGAASAPLRPGASGVAIILDAKL